MTDVVLTETAILERAEAGLIRRQWHPSGTLAIYNYTERCTYEGAWDEVTRACRGLILDAGFNVVARPFPKFFNHGEPNAPALDLDARVLVTDKLDGSLGILYPSPDGGYAVATRGSFVSDQALHATDVWRSRYAMNWTPSPTHTYLFEIIYPENRIVVDYRGLDDLVLLGAVSTASGYPSWRPVWPGPRAEEFLYPTLRDALAAEPRPGAEGLVVFFPDTLERVKLKQDDYVALHRILTGTNARNVWEVAAVRACAPYVTDAKQWGSFLRVDPARAEEVLALGDDWLSTVPDEFYGWVKEVTETAERRVYELLRRARFIISEAAEVDDRRARFELVRAAGHPAEKEIMRLAGGADEVEWGRLFMRAWLHAQPEPSAPFADREAT